MINVISSVTLPGGAKNEDYFACNGTDALFMDGSTSLGGRGPGADWFCAGFAREFFAAEGELTNCIAQALLRLRPQYDALCAQGGTGLGVKVPINGLGFSDADDTSGVSASAVFIRQCGNDLQVLSLGDCLCRVFFYDQTAATIFDGRVERLDNAVLTLMARLQAQQGGSFVSFVKDERVKAMLKYNRALMNTCGGYDVLAFNLRTLKTTEVQHFAADRIERIVLSTDGFRPLEREIEQPGADLQALGAQLRRQEAMDKECEKRHRFKVSDDATAVQLSFK